MAHCGAYYISPVLNIQKLDLLELPNNDRSSSNKKNGTT